MWNEARERREYSTQLTLDSVFARQSVDTNHRRLANGVQDGRQDTAIISVLGSATGQKSVSYLLNEFVVGRNLHLLRVRRCLLVVLAWFPGAPARSVGRHVGEFHGDAADEGRQRRTEVSIVLTRSHAPFYIRALRTDNERPLLFD